MGNSVAALRVPQDGQLRFTPRDQQLPHRTIQTAPPTQRSACRISPMPTTCAVRPGALPQPPHRCSLPSLRLRQILGQSSSGFSLW
jgi:hypothetical protein